MTRPSMKASVDYSSDLIIKAFEAAKGPEHEETRKLLRGALFLLQQASIRLGEEKGAEA